MKNLCGCNEVEPAGAGALKSSSKPKLTADEVMAIRRAPPTNMSVFEAALYLGISTRKMRGMIAGRRVKFARLGRRIVIRREYLDEVVQCFN
jgi:excisionase family DNA binding protein